MSKLIGSLDHKSLWAIESSEENEELAPNLKQQEKDRAIQFVSAIKERHRLEPVLEDREARVLSLEMELHDLELRNKKLLHQLKKLEAKGRNIGGRLVRKTQNIRDQLEQNAHRMELIVSQINNLSIAVAEEDTEKTFNIFTRMQNLGKVIQQYS